MDMMVEPEAKVARLRRPLKPNLGRALALEARDLFGGIREGARAIGVPTGTFFRWVERGVPRWRERQLREALEAYAALDDLTPPFPKDGGK
jgi:hypothetical protein